MDRHAHDGKHVCPRHFHVAQYSCASSVWPNILVGATAKLANMFVLATSMWSHKQNILLAHVDGHMTGAKLCIIRRSVQ